MLGALNRGGAESLILDVCKNLMHSSFDCLCIYRKEGNMSEDFYKSGVRILHIPKKRSMLAYMWHMRKLLQDEKVDIVHSQTPSNSLILSFILFGTGIKLITTIHGFSFLENNRIYKHIVFKSSCKILFVSNHQMHLYQKNYTHSIYQKCKVIYNGIDIEKFDRIYEIPDIYKEEDRIKLCVIGNIREARRYDVIIKAAGLLRKKQICNFALYIIGDTPQNEQKRLEYYKDLCKELEIEDTVHFVGSRGDVPAILQHSDVYIMSSIETFGISIVEAMMNGVPVIINDFDVMKEVTENGKLAMLYKTGDTNDLACKIKTIIENLESYKAWSRSNVEYVTSKYSIDSCIKQLCNIYLDV